MYEGDTLSQEALDGLLSLHPEIRRHLYPVEEG